MKDAILFDLDGTLWDSVDGCVRAWNEVLAAHPGAGDPLTPERMRSYLGKTNQQIARLMMPTLSDADAMAIMAECSAHEHDYLRAHGGGRLGAQIGQKNLVHVTYGHLQEQLHKYG